MKIVCDNLGLQQLVREPTRQQYLLDLFLTSAAGTKVGVGPYIADHRFLSATIPVPETTSLHFNREKFNISRANWSGPKTALTRID